ncbi:hypothetical protein U1Q18_009047, partial [Sarracenia purpurea var. burkii]
LNLEPDLVPNRRAATEGEWRRRNDKRRGRTATAICSKGADLFAAQIEVEFAKCECCGLTEECTEMDLRTLRRGRKGRNREIWEVDQHRRGFNSAHELLQELQLGRSAYEPCGAFDFGDAADSYFYI